jgi:drug/metabolite transporter (DMT)-like permease
VNKGILYILLSGICFLIVNFFVKLLINGPDQDVIVGLQRYPGYELVLARSLVSFVISFVVVRRRKLPLWGVNKKWLVIRSVAGTLGLSIFFYTILHLPFAVAATVQYLSPIFTIILAIIFLKERVKALQWVFISTSFIGIALIGYDGLMQKSGDIGEISLLWLGLGILSAGFSGIAYMAIMKLKATDAPITIVMYFPMIAIPVMSILCLWGFTMPRGIEWVFLLLIGIFTQFAQIMLTKALHSGTAATIVPFQYLGAIYTFLIGFYLFDETLSALVNIAIIIVVLSVVVNAVLRTNKS